jgi:pyruvate/2-oxoglutarate dehydrogenase complex dihydrolipoamide dehydrogenase (E3) component
VAQYDYNLVVIGGGSAGLVSSLIASTVKAKVALIESHKMGGDCLNTGCIPSKALIRTAKFVHDMKRHEELGIRAVQYQVDFKQVMARIQSIIKSIEPNDSVERYTNLGVKVYEDHGILIDNHTVEVGGKRITTKNIILAQGAKPFVPPIKGLEKIDYLTSDNLWELETLPPRLVVIGGGPIGCEMAQAFNRLGSKVTQIDISERLLSREDEDIAEIIQQKFTSEGIRILLDSNVVEVKTGADNTKKLVVQDVNNGDSQEIPFDALLLAVGRCANTGEIPFDTLGIKKGYRNCVGVDDYLCANKAKNIYAAGDITGRYQFTHMAAHQAYYATVNALFKPLARFKVDYSTVPWVTYTDPEIARVGINEQEAMEDGIPYQVHTFPISELDRAKTDSATEGVIKVLSDKGKILGVSLVSHNAGEMNSEFIMAMKYGLGLNDILSTIHPYPTWSEANKFLAGRWKKDGVKKWVMDFLVKFHKWRG